MENLKNKKVIGIMIILIYNNKCIIINIWKE